ncbi:MAG: FHA domain-containing protein [Hydrogenophaga sp.]|nr:FHA domain-containing protein [Hydrogenophaga sp.]MDP2094857.1 FHA domain-containing protein [Hydrogenophaga sp.]
MPKLIVSLDGVVIKEVQLTKDRTTLGRRPYNDIVIDNLALSGEHAVLKMSGSEVYLEDLASTNGTYVNGKAIKQQLLAHNDTIEVGKHKIQFLSEPAGAVFDKTMVIRSPVVKPLVQPEPVGQAAIKILSGAAAGREVPFVKVVTTMGKPGVAVVSITRRPHGYAVAVVEAVNRPKLNDQLLGTAPEMLKHGDILDLAGTKMQFVLI